MHCNQFPNYVISMFPVFGTQNSNWKDQLVAGLRAIATVASTELLLLLSQCNEV